MAHAATGPSDPAEKLILRGKDAWIVETRSGNRVVAPEHYVNNRDISIRRFLVFNAEGQQDSRSISCVYRLRSACQVYSGSKNYH
ncbi:hypothetical protein ACFOET_11045 [Parapedobacter deserti]|uniref:Uncharacterized protein n=1 Tax=Parapedobacter deserti TaxID=1912957 RepID=A0ABV7JS90_9SPHI